MLTPAAIDSLTGTTVYDSAGYLLGHVASVYVDQHSGQPTFITITTGNHSTPEQVAPFHGATLADSQIRLAYPKDDISRAPRIEPGPHLALADYAASTPTFNSPGPAPYPHSLTPDTQLDAPPPSSPTDSPFPDSYTVPAPTPNAIRPVLMLSRDLPSVARREIRQCR